MPLALSQRAMFHGKDRHVFDKKCRAADGAIAYAQVSVPGLGL